MARWGLFSGVLGVAALLAAAGCAVHVRGVSMPDPADTGTVSVSDAFGRATTVDPCSLVDVNQLPSELRGHLEPADAFDDCPVSVTLSDGTHTDVRVGPLLTQDEEPDTSVTSVGPLARGLTLYTASNNTPGTCDDYVGFSDTTVLLIAASATDPSSQANICPAADDLARGAGAQIAEGLVRHVQFPNGSAGPIDPCILVQQNTLDHIGIGDASDFEYPEMHECEWSTDSPDTEPYMYVEFIVGDQPSVLDPSTDTSQSIAGRTTIDSRFKQSISSAWCFVETGLNTFGDGNDDLVEIALVEVHTADGNTTHACDLGNSVAGSVWPQLPKTG